MNVSTLKRQLNSVERSPTNVDAVRTFKPWRCRDADRSNDAKVFSSSFKTGATTFKTRCATSSYPEARAVAGTEAEEAEEDEGEEDEDDDDNEPEVTADAAFAAGGAVEEASAEEAPSVEEAPIMEGAGGALKAAGAASGG